MTTSFNTQREVLRLRLQAQRQLFGREFSTAGYNNEQYPRSVTMSLLRGRSSLVVWAVTELLPLLVLHYLGNSGHSLLHALQARARPFEAADALPLRNR